MGKQKSKSKNNNKNTNKKANTKSDKGCGNKNLALILLFIFTFVVTVLFIGAVFKHFSIPVDVSIGNTEEETEIEDDSEYINQADIDSRLKWIQFEDSVEQSPVASEVGIDNKEENLSKKETKKSKNSEEDIPVPEIELTVPKIEPLKPKTNSIKIQKTPEKPVIQNKVEPQINKSTVHILEPILPKTPPKPTVQEINQMVPFSLEPQQ